MTKRKPANSGKTAVATKSKRQAVSGETEPFNITTEMREFAKLQHGFALTTASWISHRIVMIKLAISASDPKSILQKELADLQRVEKVVASWARLVSVRN